MGADNSVQIKPPEGGEGGIPTAHASYKKSKSHNVDIRENYGKTE